MRRNWIRDVAYAAVVLWAITGIIHNLNQPAQAATDPIIAAPGDDCYVLNDGRIMRLRYEHNPRWIQAQKLPVPVSSIAHFGPHSFVDANGNGWVCCTGPGDKWVNVGPLPDKR